MLTIDGRTYTSDVIISPEEVDSSWWRETGHEVSIADLEPILHRNPRIVIIGTGPYGIMKVLPETRFELDKRCESVYVLPTPQAVEKYNALAAENDSRTVAALHLTC